MFLFSRRDVQNEFHVIIAEERSAAVAQEYVLDASSEGDAFEAAARLVRGVCADASVPMTAFLLDADGVFLGNIDVRQSDASVAA